MSSPTFALALVFIVVVMALVVSLYAWGEP